MRLVATEYLSMDGVFEEPGHWSGPWFKEEASKFKWDELQASDALLLGRHTYEGFAKAWPNMTGTGEFGEKMNSMPKYVVSSTLDEPEWNNSTVLRGDIAEEIGKLKQEQDGDIVMADLGAAVSQGLLEGVLELGEEIGLVQELCGLELREVLPKILVGHAGDGLEQPERHVGTDDGGGLEDPLLHR